jgi:hypothetical protein
MSENTESTAGLSDERIAHLWDIHIGEPTESYPLTTADAINFARVIEREARSSAGPDATHAITGARLRGIFNSLNPESECVTKEEVDAWWKHYAGAVRNLIKSSGSESQAAAPAPTEPAMFDSLQVAAMWRKFQDSANYRQALQWIAQDEGPGALFVAFRSGLNAVHPAVPTAVEEEPESSSGHPITPLRQETRDSDESGSQAPSDEQIERALCRLVAEGETVGWYLEQAFRDDEPDVAQIMSREIVRVILTGEAA